MQARFKGIPFVSQKTIFKEVIQNMALREYVVDVLHFDNTGVGEETGKPLPNVALPTGVVPPITGSALRHAAIEGPRADGDGVVRPTLNEVHYYTPPRPKISIAAPQASSSVRTYSGTKTPAIADPIHKDARSPTTALVSALGARYPSTHRTTDRTAASGKCMIQ